MDATGECLSVFVLKRLAQIQRSQIHFATEILIVFQQTVTVLSPRVSLALSHRTSDGRTALQCYDI